MKFVVASINMSKKEQATTIFQHLQWLNHSIIAIVFLFFTFNVSQPLILFLSVYCGLYIAYPNLLTIM